jgi:hypothetical protein
MLNILLDTISGYIQVGARNAQWMFAPATDPKSRRLKQGVEGTKQKPPSLSTHPPVS